MEYASITADGKQNLFLCNRALKQCPAIVRAAAPGRPVKSGRTAGKTVKLARGTNLVPRARRRYRWASMGGYGPGGPTKLTLAQRALSRERAQSVIRQSPGYRVPNPSQAPTGRTYSRAGSTRPGPTRNVRRLQPCRLQIAKLVLECHPTSWEGERVLPFSAHGLPPGAFYGSLHQR